MYAFACILSLSTQCFAAPENDLVGTWEISEAGLADLSSEEKVLMVHDLGKLSFNRDKTGEQASLFTSLIYFSESKKIIQRLISCSYSGKFKWKILNKKTIVLEYNQSSCEFIKVIENGSDITDTDTGTQIREFITKEFSKNESQNIHILELTKASFRFWTGHKEVPVYGTAKLARENRDRPKN
jgi:hypothetical protein